MAKTVKLFRDTGRASLLDAGQALHAQRRSSGYNPLWLAALVSLWLASVGNWALWRELASLALTDGVRGLMFKLSLGLMITCLMTMLISVFAWRRSVKWVAALLLLAGALGMHYMLTYRVVIDPSMITNVLQTDWRETRDLLNWRLFFTVLLVALLPIVIIWRMPLRKTSWLKQGVRIAIIFVAAGALFSFTLGLFFSDFSSNMRNHKHLRYLINPLNSLYSLGAVALEPLHKKRGFEQIGQDAQLGASYSAQTKPPLLVLAVGETARSGNFSLNGYARLTNPQLANENVASFRKVMSCGTNTATSLPCMFSHLGHEGFNQSTSDYGNLLDVLQSAGLAVLWRDNQSAGCKGVCARVPSEMMQGLKHPEFCSSGECWDEVLLSGLAAEIAKLPNERRAKGVVVVLHQMGSHGPAYFKRTPPAYKTFQPECTSNNLPECSREHILNAYDNTIVHTDNFLASTLKWLKAQEKYAQTAMIYVADHGESLGEHHLYLHGLPYAMAPLEQKHVPLITWLSPSFEQRARTSTACLKTQLDRELSHDHLFHSVLGLMDVNTQLYQNKMDVFAACKK
jgi:lipid A ethanolaminephosphotransferase